MNKESTHTRIYADTLKNLRRIHAETGEKILDILDRLVASEWGKLQNADRQDVQVQVLPVEKE